MGFSNYYIIIILLYGMVSADWINDTILDLSDDCINNLKANYFLTSDMGIADGMAIIFAGNTKNCTINLYSDKARGNLSVQLIVVEILGDVYDNVFCKNNKIKVSDEFNSINVCIQPQEYYDNIIYTGISRNHKTTVRLIGNSSEIIKLTASSARLLNDSESCNSNREVLCRIENHFVCLHSALQCDNNINCGVHEGEDEDIHLCQPYLYKRNWYVIIPSICLIIVVIIIIVKLCYLLVPKVPKHFFTTSTTYDNKLIMLSPPPQKKVSLKNVKIKSPNIFKRRFRSPPKMVTVACGDQSDDLERELHSHFYSGGTNFKVHTARNLQQKRLTTNSPVYRNTKVATILLENIRDMTEQEEETSSLDESLSEEESSSPPPESGSYYSERRQL